MSEKHYDVAILGVWYGLNYGSLLTYYSLYKQIEETGKTIVLVKYLPEHQPVSVVDEQVSSFHNNQFIEKKYSDILEVDYTNSSSINEIADTFVIGSDQVWNYHIAKIYDDFFYMKDIGSHKRKIANSVSFGHSVDFAPENERPRISNLLKRFNAISVRERSGVGILRDVYGIDADWCADPLLTIDSEDLRSLAFGARTKLEGDSYLLAYILDPTDDKVNGISKLARKLGLSIRIIIDGFTHNRQENKTKCGMLSVYIQDDVGVEEFVDLFKNSSYVVTDSFHGTVMSLKMQKNFALVTNARMHRGFTRLECLLNLTGLTSRHTFDPNTIATKKRFITSINYERVNKIIDRTSKLSRIWLKTALDIPIDMKVGISPVFLDDDELRGILINKSDWSFGLLPSEPYSTNVNFLIDGTISGIESENERFWKVENSRLEIFNVNKNLTHIFWVKSINWGRAILQGEMMDDHTKVHFLK